MIRERALDLHFSLAHLLERRHVVVAGIGGLLAIQLTVVIVIVVLVELAGTASATSATHVLHHRCLQKEIGVS
jgi:hypothetical protein